MSLNPIDTPGAFRDILIAGRPFPGRIKDIRGLELVIDWNNVKVPELLGWTSRWMGRKLADSIEVDVCYNAETQAQVKANYADHLAFRRHLLGGANPNAKPPGLSVTCALFAAVFIKQIVVKKITSPIFRVGAPIMVTFTFQDYAKGVPIVNAAPEAAKLTDGAPEPKTIAEQTFVDAVAQLNAVQAADALSASQIQTRYPGVGQ